MRIIGVMLVLAALAMMTAQAAYTQPGYDGCYPGARLCVDGDTGETFPNPNYDPNVGPEGLPPGSFVPTATPSSAVTATATTPAEAQYDGGPTLPATGGPALAIMAGVLLVASGVIARKIL